jgi:DNA-binding transcriptional MerR regulator
VTVETPEGAADARLLRIQEVADEVGLTPRAIRHYEELGLIKPAARSDGDYRLYDDADVERLRFIKGLRDETGFSLAEIGQLLEDEDARALDRTRFRDSRDPFERRRLLEEGIDRIDRQVATLQGKVRRIEEMIVAAKGRREHLTEHLDALERGVEPAHHRARRRAGTGSGR